MELMTNFRITKKRVNLASKASKWDKSIIERYLQLKIRHDLLRIKFIQ